MIQNFNNLPAEIRDSKRFFLVAENKIPLQKGWQLPENQKAYTEINGLAGFDTVGHGVADDYLFLDFDHVLNADGDFVNETVEDFFGELVLTFKNIYVEKSISGTGLHLFMKPSPDKFKTVSNGNLGVYHFNDSKDKDAPKLELFYGSGGRYCLVTGNLFDCDEGAELNIPAGVEVDEYLSGLLEDIQKQLGDNGIEKTARSTENIFADNFAAEKEYEDQPRELKQDLILAIMAAVPVDTLTEDTEWLAFMSACKNEGVDYSYFDNWCSKDPKKYNAKENKTRWDSITNPSYKIGIISNKAKAVNFDFKDFYRQWYKKHPEYQQARFESEENKLAADIKDFEEEKHSAIEYLNSLVTFDRATVTDEKTLKAAAFAKLFDAQAFSKFKVDLHKYGFEHPNEKVSLPDITSAMKEFVTDINSHRLELERRGNVLKANKDTAAFFAADDFLSDFNRPQNYLISADGVFEQRGDKYFQICYTPIIISDKYYNLDTKKYSLRLAFKPVKWLHSPIVNPSVVFNQRKFPDLSDYDLPVDGVNAYALVKYLQAFKVANAEVIPVTCLVDKCGWRKINGKLEFIDPRRNVSIIGESDIPHPVKPVETSFTTALKSVGSLDKWRSIYEQVKKYPVARAMVAAAVSSPLLRIVGERNFVFYIWADTTAGKTAALKFAASAVGEVDKIVKVLNATANSITGVAANYDDYFVAFDEKEEADDKLRDNLKAVVYRIANGVDKGRMNKDLTLREQRIWRSITAITGETELLDDNTTGGALRRLLSISAPSPILPADLCKQIYNTIDQHYGLVLPRVIDEIFKQGFNNLRDMFNDFVEEFQEGQPAIVFEHCRYIATLTLGDFLLNVALGVEENQAHDDAVESMLKLFEYIPTKAEITDSSRARDLVLGFIAQNQKRFIGAVTSDLEKIDKPFGKFSDDDNGNYITVKALKQACYEGKTDYKKLVKDLKTDGFFIPEKGEYQMTKKIGKVNDRCFKIAAKFFK